MAFLIWPLLLRRFGESVIRKVWNRAFRIFYDFRTFYNLKSLPKRKNAAAICQFIFPCILYKVTFLLVELFRTPIIKLEIALVYVWRVLIFSIFCNDSLTSCMILCTGSTAHQINHHSFIFFHRLDFTLTFYFKLLQNTTPFAFVYRTK